MARQVTLQDIAESLNLSPSSVSRALSGKKGVSEATRNRVMAAARRMGYVPVVQGDNPSFHSLLLAENSTLCEPIFYADILRGLAAEMATQHGSLSIAITDRESQTLRIPPALQHVGHVNAVVGIHRTDPRVIEYVRELGLPLVLVDYLYPDHGADTVDPDGHEGARTLTLHLASLGHRRFGFVGDLANRSFRMRMEGVLQALHGMGLPASNLLTVTEPEQLPSTLSELPTALVCCNDAWAMTTVNVLRGRDISVPTDVSVAGFDDNHSAESTIGLTSMRVYRDELGRWAARLLRCRWENPGNPPIRVMCRTEMVIRESTTTPRTYE